jgi:hypothetical protein
MREPFYSVGRTSHAGLVVPSCLGSPMPLISMLRGRVTFLSCLLYSQGMLEGTINSLQFSDTVYTPRGLRYTAYQAYNSMPLMPDSSGSNMADPIGLGLSWRSARVA